MKGGKFISEIQLVKQATNHAGSVFGYFLQIMENFPAHQTRAY